MKEINDTQCVIDFKKQKNYLFYKLKILSEKNCINKNSIVLNKSYICQALLQVTLVDM